MDPDREGGAAFPRPASELHAGTPARDAQPGMTLRDYFAGQALAGLLAARSDAGANDALAEIAYAYAIDMLAARDRVR